MSLAITPAPWTADALCAETDPEMFHPHEQDKKTVRAAKDVCNRCPVLTECLTDAVTRGEKHGIWGGTTPDERNTLRMAERRNRRRASTKA